MKPVMLLLLPARIANNYLARATTNHLPPCQAAIHYFPERVGGAASDSPSPRPGQSHEHDHRSAAL